MLHALFISSFTDFSGATHGREESDTLPCRKTSGISPMWSVLIKFLSHVFRPLTLLYFSHLFPFGFFDSFCALC